MKRENIGPSILHKLADMLGKGENGPVCVCVSTVLFKPISKPSVSILYEFQ